MLCSSSVRAPPQRGTDPQISRAAESMVDAFQRRDRTLPHEYDRIAEQLGRVSQAEAESRQPQLPHSPQRHPHQSPVPMACPVKTLAAHSLAGVHLYSAARRERQRGSGPGACERHAGAFPSCAASTCSCHFGPGACERHAGAFPSCAASTCSCHFGPGACERHAGGRHTCTCASASASARARARRRQGEALPLSCRAACQ